MSLTAQTSASRAVPPENRRSKTRRQVDEVRVSIERLIEQQRLAPGARLETERAIARRLSAPRSIVRAAFAELELTGRILRHVGRGTFVASHPANLQSERALTLNASPIEFIDFRLLFEPSFLGQTVLHGSDAELQEIADCAERSRAAKTPREYNDWDHRFHRLVAAATHNRLVMSVYDAVGAIRQNAAWGKLKSGASNPSRWLQYCDEHRRVADALIRRDAEAAQRLMTEHLLHVRSVMTGSR